MNSLPEILDISSDDEQGFPETGGGDGDDCDWLARLLIDAADDKQNLPEDDSDEVVVVGEFINDMRNSNSRESTAMLRDFDDDCVVLDGDPNNSVSEVNDDDTPDNGSDECLIVGGKGQVKFSSIQLVLIVLELRRIFIFILPCLVAEKFNAELDNIYFLCKFQLVTLMNYAKYVTFNTLAAFIL